MKQIDKKYDESGQKKDSEKLTTIKKGDKIGDSKISAAKKYAICQVVTGAKNQTPFPASSTSNVNLFTQFINSQGDFTPLASTFTSGLFNKNPILSKISTNSFVPFVFGQPFLVSIPMEVNSYSPASPDPDESTSIEQSSHTVQPSMPIISEMNSPESTTSVKPMEDSDSDNLSIIHQYFHSLQPSIQNSVCGNTVDSQQCSYAVQTVEKNTGQMSMPSVKFQLKSNVNLDGSLNIQKFSVSEPPLVKRSPKDLLKAKQLSVPMQTKTSNTTSNTSSTATCSNTTLSITTSSATNKKPLKSENYATVELKKKATEVLKKKATKGLKKKATEGSKKKSEEIVKKSKNFGAQKKKKKKNRVMVSQNKKVEQFNTTIHQHSPVVGNLNPLLCAIVEEQYPNMPPLTNIHLKIIQNVIKDKIDKLPFGVFVPKFLHSFIKNGVILVECADNQSKEWLEKTLTNYNPEEGIYLKVVPAEAVNQYYAASIFVHDEGNAYDVLTRIQKQNSDISIKNWQYISMIVVKESTPGITIHVGIPATSVAHLKEKNFKLFHAADQVTVVMRDKIPF